MRGHHIRIARSVAGVTAAAVFIAAVAGAAYAAPGAPSTNRLAAVPTTATDTGSPDPSDPPTEASPVAPTPTATSPATPPAHFATITLTLSLDPEPGADGDPIVESFSVTNAPVGDGLELLGTRSAEQSALGCTAAVVDIAANLSSVSVGAEGPVCMLTGMKVVITIDGVTFAAVTAGNDTLFALLDAEEARGAGGPGHPAMLRLVPAALNAPYPVLTSATASGSTLTLTWHGSEPARMMGGASFALTLGAAGAKPASGFPVFTG